MSKVPKVRFPEFVDDWSHKKLGDIVSFFKGSILSKNDLDDNGDISCILYGQLYTKYNEIASEVYSRTSNTSTELVFSKEEDVILPTSGETSEDISTATCILQEGVALGGDILILRSNMITGKFLSYYLNHPLKYKIASVAQGKSVVHISERSLSILNINYPDKTEQQKISSLLLKVDNRIQTQKSIIYDLENQKKGLLQRIFNQEIRFKMDDGSEYPDWEEKRISDCLTYEQPTKYIVDSENYSDNHLIPVLTANKGFILGYTNEKDGVYDKGEVIIYDDFTMDMKFVTFSFKVKSSAMKMLTTINDCNIYFMYCKLLSLNFKPEGHSRTYISKVEPLMIDIPCKEEQQKIAICLLTFDQKIQKEREILEDWQQIKKGLLQQMFA